MLSELKNLPQAFLYGLDIAPENIKLANETAANARLTCGDGHHLPYPDHLFDIVFCHYLLLWVENPGQVIREMQRVARPGGAILALAEPDYAGRIDYPEILKDLGRRQAEGLQRQGANPDIGRRLAGLFSQAGLGNIEVGILGAQWQIPIDPQDWRMEWKVMRNDLQGSVKEEMLAELEEFDRRAWEIGERILYLPTFYAWGRKPQAGLIKQH